MYKATVSGSFRRHLTEVQAAIDELKRHNVRVLSPTSTSVVGVEDGFVYLATDPSKDPGIVEDGHVRAIRRSDFLWLVCPDGELGDSTSFEIGSAAAYQKRIFCLNDLHDDFDGLTNPNNLVTKVHGVAEALAILEKDFDAVRKLIVLTPGLRTKP